MSPNRDRMEARVIEVVAPIGNRMSPDRDRMEARVVEVVAPIGTG